MEDQNKPNSNPQQPQHLTELSGSSYISSSQLKKVLQPSATLVQEVKAEQAERAAAEPQQSRTDIQGSSSQQSIQSPASPPTPVEHKLSSIYPEATRGINSNGIGYPAPTPVNRAIDDPEKYTFNEGYEIGKSIFIYQLIAGLIIGLLSSHFIQTFYHTPIVLAMVYVVEYLVTLLYLPYYLLQSEKVEEPLWVTFIGTAVQTIIIGMGYALFTVVLKAMGSLGIFELVVGIGFLIASYFFTKLSWGVAFSLVGKVKNKAIVKAIGVGMIALFVGSIAYHFVTQPSNRVGSTVSNATTSAQKSPGLIRYQVSGNPSFSANFYEGSKATSGASGGDLTYSTGHAAQGVNLNISNAITLNATSSCSSAENKSEFNFQIQGSTGIVCVSNNKSMTSYIGHIQVNSKSYVINMFAFNYQQNLATVKAIFNSITIE